MQCRRKFRLDREDANAAGIPRGNAADQPAAPYCDEQGVDLWRIFLDLEPDRPLANHCLGWS